MLMLIPFNVLCSMSRPTQSVPKKCCREGAVKILFRSTSRSSSTIREPMTSIEINTVVKRRMQPMVRTRIPPKPVPEAFGLDLTVMVSGPGWTDLVFGPGWTDLVSGLK